MSGYNPFSPAGLYNINTKLYNNKKTVLGALFIAGLLVILTLVNAVTSPASVAFKPSFNVPSPTYGYGPFGYGNYLPPEHILVNSIS